MPLQPPVDDGLTMRTGNAWTRLKLDIIECYLEGFSVACGQSRSHAVVDGFAGPGVNQFDDTGELRWGSPMIAALASPRIPKLLAMDLDTDSIAALEARATRVGADRLEVRPGDVNTDLAPWVADRLHPKEPCLIILDPEGVELDFDTVRTLSTCRGTKRPELLILLATHTGLVRLLWERGVPPWAEDKLDRLFGTAAWRDVYVRRFGGELSADEAITEHVRLYCHQLESLGYTHVAEREIRTDGRTGRPGYSLVFAGDHPAGANIIESCFDTRFGPQATLFAMPRPRRV